MNRAARQCRLFVVCIGLAASALCQTDGARAYEAFGFETNELLKIFDGFKILKYEDKPGVHEWSGKKVRLVRLIAQK